MDLKNIGEFFDTIADGAKRHSPEIFVAIGVGAGIGALVTGITGTIKAKKLVDKRKEELGVSKLSAKETIKTVWKCYILPASLAVASTTAIASGTKISINRTAAMGALYNAGRDMFDEYKKSAIETVGNDKADEIDEKVNKKEMEKNNLLSNTETSGCVILNEDEKQTFIEAFSGRSFQAKMNEIEKAVNDFNKELRNEDSLKLNDWYYYLHRIDPRIDTTDAGEILGWDMSYTGYLEISTQAVMNDGKACVLIRYATPPMYIG